MKVYYNSACPVCKAGIEGQKGKDGTCDIEWNEVDRDNAVVADVDAELEFEFVRERLHVVDEEGAIHVAFDAFLAIWRNSPRETWKATVFGLPVVGSLCGVAYNVFAAALYRWNRSHKHW